jgi:hypothetical protein
LFLVCRKVCRNTVKKFKNKEPAWTVHNLLAKNYSEIKDEPAWTVQKLKNKETAWTVLKLKNKEPAWTGKHCRSIINLQK